MKTLKQIFKNICDNSNMCDERLDCLECATDAVKEWIQQELLSLNKSYAYNRDHLKGQQDALKKLLEDIDQ